MEAVHFRSEDRRFEVSIRADLIQALQDHCSRFTVETGGVLIGYYTTDQRTAMVTRMEPAPPDSRAGRTWFRRGTKGLHRLLKRLWRKRRQEYYLGEWHLHPGGSPQPSWQDLQQMQGIADDPAVHCPEPVLLILGGSPESGWQFAVNVFRRGATPVELD